MAHTYAANFIHCIFSTRDRRSRLPALFILVEALLFLPPRVFAQPPRASEGASRKVFGLEGSFDNPDPLPIGVVKALMSSGQSTQTRGWMRARNDFDPNHYFVAKEVHLATPAETDYVVLGRIPGADCLQFWVIHFERGSPRVVLFDSTLSVVVLTSRTNGMSDIQTVWESPNETHTKNFHFNGKRYRLVSQNWQDHFEK